MDIKELLRAERQAMEGFFRENKIYARVDKSRSIYADPSAGFIRYALQLRQDQRFEAVEKVHRELSAVLTNTRRRMGLAKVTALPVSEPIFGIEVQHPAPKALHWSPRILDLTPAHSMALGKSYEDGAANEYFAFADSVHCLVVGITGAGKSVLLQNMLLSLCYATPPDELKIILVDLKNEDMVPFAHLPHLMQFVGNKKNALDAIRYVVDEKEKRVNVRGYKPFRLVLWVDELAQLADNKDARNGLGDLASIGRSKWIHLVGATQHPTEAGGLGSMLKANFPLRLVGMVANGQSHIATGRPKLHADLLPGRGAFLRIEGPRVVRFQSYRIDVPTLAHGVSLVQARWGSQQKRLPAPVETPALTAPITVQPVGKRDEIDDIADRIRALWEANASKNAMAKAAGFKGYAGSYAIKIDEAIKRLASSTLSSTEPSPPASPGFSSTSEGEAADSSRSADAAPRLGIIRLPKRAANG